MADLLRMEYINSLPQPFFVRLCGSQDRWPVYDIDVETGLMRIDVCGKLDVKHIGEVADVFDCDGGQHDPDTFYFERESR